MTTGQGAEWKTVPHFWLYQNQISRFASLLQERHPRTSHMPRSIAGVKTRYKAKWLWLWDEPCLDSFLPWPVIKIRHSVVEIARSLSKAISISWMFIQSPWRKKLHFCNWSLLVFITFLFHYHFTLPLSLVRSPAGQGSWPCVVIGTLILQGSKYWVTLFLFTDLLSYWLFQYFLLTMEIKNSFSRESWVGSMSQNVTLV